MVPRERVTIVLRRAYRRSRIWPTTSETIGPLRTQSEGWVNGAVVGPTEGLGSASHLERVTLPKSTIRRRTTVQRPANRHRASAVRAARLAGGSMPRRGCLQQLAGRRTNARVGFEAARQWRADSGNDWPRARNRFRHCASCGNVAVRHPPSRASNRSPLTHRPATSGRLCHSTSPGWRERVCRLAAHRTLTRRVHRSTRRPELGRRSTSARHG
jgi:hypothetical protein